MSDKVRCKDCGFLALRKADTRELLDAESHFREKGKLPLRSKATERCYDNFPICFACVADFKKETSGDADKLKTAVNQPRECEKFTPWLQGFTPKEHFEMIQQTKLLEWQREREEADREWRERQAANEREWRREDMAIAKRNVWITLIVAAIGFVGGLVAVWFSDWLSN